LILLSAKDKMSNLAGFLTGKGVEFEFLEKKVTHHAQEAAQASGLSLSEIVKTIVFVTEDKGPIIGIVQGDRSISRHKLQQCSGAKSMRIAPDKVAESATGFPTGGIPPVGHRRQMPVFIDTGVMAHEYVWCGGGSRQKLVKLKTADILRLSEGKICDLRM